MELFNKFRDTIILTDDCAIEKQVEQLKKMRESMNSTYQIDRDIKLLEAGLQGEKNIMYELKNANIGMYVLRNITIQYRDMTAQIDFVVVTKAHIYLIECKNMIGDITINNEGEFKRDYSLNGKRIKEAIYSPLTQAQRHKEILKKIWMSKHHSVTTFFLEKLFDKTYKPLVVLVNSKSLLNMKYAPKEVKNATVRIDQLITYIKNDIKNCDKSLYVNKNEMLNRANSIMDNVIESNDNFVKRYSASYEGMTENETKKETDSLSIEAIKEKLKSFRKEKAQKMNVPAYYVFTNDELEAILSLLPKNLEELRNSKILSSIKLKCHGQEIVDIIGASIESQNVK